jgi:hypothetical protein
VLEIAIKIVPILMISCIFTIDYEVYGNGQGSLRQLVHEPARKLKEIFDKAGAKLVLFVEAAELSAIRRFGSDSAIHDVEQQIRDFHSDGFEIGLHLHPQWCKAEYVGGTWRLEYREYNLCTLKKDRISEIVTEAIHYLRQVLGDSTFTPASFRAGNWLFQPTQPAGEVLAECGIEVDSSVFKGGLQRSHKLDYRPAMANGYYWNFNGDVNIPNSEGSLLEIPIYTQSVPFWRMLTSKRLAMQQKSNASAQQAAQRPLARICRFLDYFRLLYPKKLDFCRMTASEMTRMLESIILEDSKTPDIFRPVVAIGHTKDLSDFRAVERFLSWLKEQHIMVATLNGVSAKCQR